MNVIFLNTWHSEMKSALHAYIEKHLQGTDVFCFQEACLEDRSLYQELLSYDFALHATERLEPDGSWLGNAVYVRKSIPILDKGSLFTTKPEGLEVGLVAFVTLQLPGVELTIGNVHGASQPGDKMDTPDRLYQSKTILSTFKDKEAVIVGGDFNLLPTTQSIQTFPQHGYRDLIAEYDIKTTRNRIIFEKYPENIQHYADYAFVSSTVNVVDFSVPTDIVSDHQPLELTFECVGVQRVQELTPQSQYSLA